MNTLNDMDTVNQVNTVNSLKAVNAVNAVKAVNALNTMDQMNTMNTMNSGSLQSHTGMSAYELQLTSGQLQFLSDTNQSINRTDCLRTLIDRASLQVGTYSKKGFETVLDIGQLAISEVELADLWHCNRKSASKLIDRFNELGFISSKQGNRTSVHTILCVSRWLVDGKVIDNPHAVIPQDFLRGREPCTDNNCHASDVASDD